MSKSFNLPVRFNVSQIRTAACCPRIFVHDLYLTRRNKYLNPYVTKIWQKPLIENEKIITAGGSLFHNSIEKFNKATAFSNDILKIFEEDDAKKIHQQLMIFYQLNCLNRLKFIEMKPESMEAFSNCVSNYIQEVVDIVLFGKSKKITPLEIQQQLFGDHRKNVDATFYVGPEKKPVHITGKLDYVFYDWRYERHRILDYKLMPSGDIHHDLFQVTTYALMHHHQHGTEPDVAIFYLYPQRSVYLHTWDKVYSDRHVVYDLLGSMHAWWEFVNDDSKGMHPPGNVSFCGTCTWNKKDYCIDELGPKLEGKRLIWHKEGHQVHDPEFEVAKIPEIEVETEIAEEDEEFDPKIEKQKAELEEKAVVEKSEPVIRNEGRVNELIPGKIGEEFVSIPASILNTHVAVVGAAGSGKTWMAKIIAEEAIRSGVPVLAIDPQGDIVQFLKKGDKSKVPEEYHAFYDEFHARKEVRIFTPGTSHAKRVCLSPLRLPSMSELAGIKSEDRRQEEYDGMLAATAGNLVSLADVGGDEKSQKTFLFKLLGFLGKNSDRTLQLSDVIAGLISPEGCGIEDPTAILRNAEREKLFRRLNNFLEGPSSALFTKGMPIDIEELITPSETGKVPLNIIYLNALNSDEEKQFFVSMLAAEVYRWMVTSAENTGKTNLLFYIDEARDFIPAGSKNTPAKQALIRLFTQGRKYGVGCLLCTQSPRSVDYNVFGNCSSKFIGRMEASQDIDRIGEWFTSSGPVPSWIRERNGAPKGTFVGRWPGIKEEHEGVIIKTRQLFSEHQGAWPPEKLENEYHQ